MELFPQEYPRRALAGRVVLLKKLATRPLWGLPGGGHPCIGDCRRHQRLEALGLEGWRRVGGAERPRHHDGAMLQLLAPLSLEEASREKRAITDPGVCPASRWRACRTPFCSKKSLLLLFFLLLLLQLTRGIFVLLRILLNCYLEPRSSVLGRSELPSEPLITSTNPPLRHHVIQQRPSPRVPRPRRRPVEDGVQRHV